MRPCPANVLALALAATLGCRAARARSSPPDSAAAAEPGAAGDAARDELEVGGILATRYRGRWAAGSDHDVRQVLGLDLAAPEAGWRASVLGRLALDLGSREEGADTLFGLDDTYGDRLVARLDHGWIEWEEPLAGAALRRLRVGRQLLGTRELPTAFDGALFEAAPRPDSTTRYGAFGGVPYHPYESSPSGDLLFGAWLELVPVERTHLRVDWLHAEDERGRLVTQGDLLALALRRTFADAGLVELAVSSLEGRARDVRLVARHHELDDAGEAWGLDVSYYRLLSTQRAEAVPFDPFFSTLFELSPYQQLGLLATRRLGARAGVDVGLDVRRLVDDADRGAFNRDYERGFATLSLFELYGAWDLDLTAERWSAEDVIESWGVELSRDLGQARLALGSEYARYEYDLFQARERDHVRTWSARYRRPLGGATLDLRYSFEEDDIDDFHTLRIGTTWRF